MFYICRNFFIRFKIFWWIKLIVTNAKASRRIHTSTSTMYNDQVLMGENVSRCTQIDIGGHLSICDEAFQQTFTHGGVKTRGRFMRV